MSRVTLCVLLQSQTNEGRFEMSEEESCISWVKKSDTHWIAVTEDGLENIEIKHEEVGGCSGWYAHTGQFVGDNIDFAKNLIENGCNAMKSFNHLYK